MKIQRVTTEVDPETLEPSSVTVTFSLEGVSTDRAVADLVRRCSLMVTRMTALAGRRVPEVPPVPAQDRSRVPKLAGRRAGPVPPGMWKGLNSPSKLPAAAAPPSKRPGLDPAKALDAYANFLHVPAETEITFYPKSKNRVALFYLGIRAIRVQRNGDF